LSAAAAESRRRGAAARSFTRYLEATGNTAAIKSVDLVARVQGFLQSINYKDGAFVKEGTSLFTIEPDTYKLKLEQAQAAESGAQATVRQAEADFKRQQDLVQRQAVSQATLDTSTSTRDNAQANLLQAQVNTKIAAVNYGYTNVPRRSTASSARISSPSANSSARRRRRSLPPSWRSTRSGEFQRQRTGRAADPRRRPAGAG
jgi:multidrug efflux pump subunit AcrA (membrane-fusion protein)